MKVGLSRLVSLTRHVLRDTMGPWVAASLTLHAGLIAAVLPDGIDDTRLPAAGGAIAVDILIVEGPDARAAAATGATGDHPSKPDTARNAERRAPMPAPPDLLAMPDDVPTPPDMADAAMPETTETTPLPSPGADAAAAAPRPPATRSEAVARKTPPSTAAPVILAPRPRSKPPPPPAEPAARPAATADAPAGEAPHNVDPDAHGDDADRAAATASSAGGSRGASPAPGNPKPVYPDRARRQGTQGRVVLRVEVLPDGGAGAVAIDRSSGDAGLDEAAVAAVRQWRFRPALRGGTPVAAQVRVPIRFRLE